MRELVQKLFDKSAPSELSNPEDVQAELDRRLRAIVKELRRLKLPGQQIIDELHDSVERVTEETENGRTSGLMRSDTALSGSAGGSSLW